jgi:hypothetical protein
MSIARSLLLASCLWQIACAQGASEQSLSPAQAISPSNVGRNVELTPVPNPGAATSDLLDPKTEVAFDDRDRNDSEYVYGRRILHTIPSEDSEARETLQRTIAQLALSPPLAAGAIPLDGDYGLQYTDGNSAIVRMIVCTYCGNGARIYFPSQRLIFQETKERLAPFLVLLRSLRAKQ